VMFNIKIFDYVSQIVRDFVAKHDVREFEIQNADFKLMYALWCKSVDEMIIENPQWNEVQKAFCKKAALIGFSKVGSDSVYIPLVERFVKKLRDSKVFK
jgi:hypothetical protein